MIKESLGLKFKFNKLKKTLKHRYGLIKKKKNCNKNQQLKTCNNFANQLTFFSNRNRYILM